jgi:hypothetical protein
MMPKKYNWTYDEKITAEEFLLRLVPLVNEPVRTLWECDGDMFMSDYAKLCDAAARLRVFQEQVKKKEEGK